MSPVYHEFDAVLKLDTALTKMVGDSRSNREAREAFDQIERALFNLRLASERAGIPLSADVERWANSVAHRLTLPAPTTTPHEEK